MTYGKKRRIMERSAWVLLIDEEGMIIKAKERVKTADNPKEMLEALS